MCVALGLGLGLIFFLAFTSPYASSEFFSATEARLKWKGKGKTLYIERDRRTLNIGERSQKYFEERIESH